MPKILIIEDDVHLQNMLVTLLNRNNYEVDAVFEGGEGVDKIKQNDYDLVITDMHMPDTDGLDVIERIHALNENMPIIGMSGGDQLRGRDMSKLHLARKMGISHVFKKPFEHEELLEAIKQELEPENKKGLFGLIG